MLCVSKSISNSLDQAFLEVHHSTSKFLSEVFQIYAKLGIPHCYEQMEIHRKIMSLVFYFNSKKEAPKINEIHQDQSLYNFEESQLPRKIERLNNPIEKKQPKSSKLYQNNKKIRKEYVHKKTLLPKEEEEKLIEWILKEKQKNKHISYLRLQQKAKKLSTNQSFQASTHWAKKFIARHPNVEKLWRKDLNRENENVGNSESESISDSSVSSVSSNCSSFERQSQFTDGFMTGKQDWKYEFKEAV